MGGYYALYLSKLEKVKKIVLLNPSINPVSTLTRALGDAPNFYDNTTFRWEKQHLNLLKEYKRNDIQKDKIFLLVQKGDELLDFSEAVKALDGAKMKIQDGGNHSFVDVQNFFKEIDEFFDIAENHF